MLPALLSLALSVSPEAAREAKALTRHAMNEYDAGQFERSIEDTTHAFELDPLPALLFNMAQCHRALQHWEKAEFFYRRYLAHVPDAQNRKMVEALIGAVQSRQGKAPAANAPALPELGPAAGAPGEAAFPKVDLEQKTAKAEPGLMRNVEQYPPVVVVREDVEGPSNPTRSWAWGTTWLALGLAVVGAGAGVANVVETNGLSSTQVPPPGSQAASVRSQMGLAQGFGIAADALFIGAGASAVAGLALFLVSRKSDAAPAMSVGPAPAGLGLGASGSF